MGRLLSWKQTLKIALMMSLIVYCPVCITLKFYNKTSSHSQTEVFFVTITVNKTGIQNLQLSHTRFKRLFYRSAIVSIRRAFFVRYSAFSNFTPHR